MRIGRAVVASTCTLLICASASIVLRDAAAAQQTAPQQASAQQKGAPQKTDSPAPAATAPKIQATLNQVMRGMLFPDANVIFFAQNEDPAAVKEATKPSGATDPLAGVYGGWAAVENSSLALSETATVLLIPGRVCSNGRVAPVKNADWVKFVDDLRIAGLVAYQAARSKSTDKMLDAADQVSTSCLNCHDRYRKNADRCI